MHLPEEDCDTQGGQVFFHDVPRLLHGVDLLRCQVLVQVVLVPAVNAGNRRCVAHAARDSGWRLLCFYLWEVFVYLHSALRNLFEGDL